ncbi:uncharacterized protein LOC128670209 [Plodia interpunctella]|uniref:uncharacterized protein LOC128670209 n=1 Tax=Plodia interpunctella TaxID=58824 RepID=UPI002367E4B2|nr:uncharacterized protein LOC128670209 [Plodia interpunctella]
MRIVTIMAVALSLAAALWVRRCEGAGLRGLARPDDEEDYRPRPLYRDYRLMHRIARADDSFDDYGHLRFGRSED